MQYKVPQNIDLEDKIVGPFTLMQFIYLMAGGVIIYIAFDILYTWAFILVSLPVAIVTICLVFVKVQDQPFSKFLISLLFYIFRPKTRVWHKDSGSEKFDSELASKKEVKKTNTQVIAKNVEKSELEKLAEVLDVGENNKTKKVVDAPKETSPVEDIFSGDKKGANG